MFQVGAYYTHYQCLGHTSRVLALLKILKKRFPKLWIYLLQGSKHQPFLIFPDFIKIFNIPCPLFNKESFRKSLNIKQEIFEFRASSILKILKKNKIDIFITEYFPLGRAICQFELLPSLYFLKKRNKVVVSSAGYPVISEKSFKKIDFFSKFYNKIYIHSPTVEKQYIGNSYKKLKEKNRYYDFFKKNHSKIKFTGYVLADQLNFYKKEELFVKPNKINILVTRGAGAYYPNIIEKAIKTSDLLNEDFYFTILSGPSTSELEWSSFKKLIEKKKFKNITLKKHSFCLKSLIKESDLCISTASYNTSVDLLYYRKKAIIIPFEGYSNSYYREQPSRAKLLADFIGSSIISYYKLDQMILKRKILYQMNKNKTTNNDIPKHWFQGGYNFSKDFYSFLPPSTDHVQKKFH